MMDEITKAMARVELVSLKARRKRVGEHMQQMEAEAVKIKESNPKGERYKYDPLKSDTYVQFTIERDLLWAQIQALTDIVEPALPMPGDMR